jgi:glycosyltransferase involved in cell wall biosynthesis
LYFKASDVLTLPYTSLSQSGVLLLAYSFGLPVIAADWKVIAAVTRDVYAHLLEADPTGDSFP